MIATFTSTTVFSTHKTGATILRTEDMLPELLQMVTGWRQQLIARAGCALYPPSAFVQLRTAGQTSQLRRQKG